MNSVILFYSLLILENKEESIRDQKQGYSGFYVPEKYVLMESDHVVVTIQMISLDVNATGVTWTRTYGGNLEATYSLLPDNTFALFLLDLHRGNKEEITCSAQGAGVLGGDSFHRIFLWGGSKVALGEVQGFHIPFVWMTTWTSI